MQWGAGSTPSHAPLHGRTEMGEAQFVKLLRDTGLLDKEGPGALFTSRHADLVYAKVKGKVGWVLGAQGCGIWASMEPGSGEGRDTHV